MSACLEKAVYTITGEVYVDGGGWPAQIQLTVPFGYAPGYSQCLPVANADVWDPVARSIAATALANGWKQIDSITKELETTQVISAT